MKGERRNSPSTAVIQLISFLFGELHQEHRVPATTGCNAGREGVVCSSMRSSGSRTNAGLLFVASAFYCPDRCALKIHHSLLSARPGEGKELLCFSEAECSCRNPELMAKDGRRISAFHMHKLQGRWSGDDLSLADWCAARLAQMFFFFSLRASLSSTASRGPLPELAGKLGCCSFNAHIRN